MQVSMISHKKARWFIALLPPTDLQIAVNQFKQDFADRYNSTAAQKSPPHITLQPPFLWAIADLQNLINLLTEFAQSRSPFTVHLSGFAAFPPRVIFVNVIPSATLHALQADLHTVLSAWVLPPEAPQHPFHPHMTIAFRDLTPANFRAAWSEYQARPFQADFWATGLTLLRHDGQCWQVEAVFSFLGDASAGSP